MPVAGVVVAGEIAPRCRGVYGTYLGAGIAADASTVLVDGEPDGENDAGAGGGERSGCAVRLSWEALRGTLTPDRPIDPVGKRPSRLDILRACLRFYWISG